MKGGEKKCDIENVVAAAVAVALMAAVVVLLFPVVGAFVPPV